VPDISMCAGKGCDRRETCYRFKATPTPGWQSYANFDRDPAACTHYWETDPDLVRCAGPKISRGSLFWDGCPF
jgi:hypothetical protein